MEGQQWQIVNVADSFTTFGGVIASQARAVVPCDDRFGRELRPTKGLGPLRAQGPCFLNQWLSSTVTVVCRPTALR